MGYMTVIQPTLYSTQIIFWKLCNGLEAEYYDVPADVLAIALNISIKKIHNK